MLSKEFVAWWSGRVRPFREVPPEKLEADRHLMRRQQQFNQHYADFLNSAALPAIDDLVKLLVRCKIAHRISSWGNQISIRVHLAWRWAELIIGQTHEDCVNFAHHIVTETERKGEEGIEDHNHTYDLHEPLPPSIVQQELQFFLSRIAQDLIEPDPE